MRTLEPIKRAERKSLKKMVIQEIKRYIINNELKAMDKLPTERKFMEMFDVSRSVVREALSYLENTGVITTTQGKGAFLNESNIDKLLQNFFFLWQINNGKISDILGLRVIFESSAIDEIILHHNKEELKLLQEIVASSKQATSHEEFRSFDIAFHTQLLKATNNHLFTQMTNMITSYFFEIKHIHVTMTDEDYRVAIKEHEDIVTKLIEGNATSAKALLTKHIRHTKI